MANTAAVVTWVTNETALRFVNSLKLASNFNRSYTPDEHGGAKVGDFVKVRLPQQWDVTDGQAFQQQNILDQTVQVTLTNQKGVHFGFSSAQGTTDLDKIRERYVNPAADALANAADVLAGYSVYPYVYNVVGAPGTAINSVLTYAQGGVKLDQGSTPDDGRIAVLSPNASATIAAATNTFFHPGATISGNYRRGQMANAEQIGFDEWFKDQNIPVHTTGTVGGAGGTPLVNGANQTGSTLVSDGWASGTTSLKRGDWISVGGIQGLNPLSKAPTGSAPQFVVTADISDTTGAITIPIYPSIITSGALRNVSASPADNAVITYLSMAAGATQTATLSSQSMLFHRDAFAFVMADLIMPEGGANGRIVNSRDWNISIRYTEQWQSLTDQNLKRLDILIGAGPLQPRLACRAAGAA